jgi:aspartokinase-like uncharacterized kinase
MNGQPDADLAVVKVGGSLYDYSKLASRLTQFLDALGSAQIAIFPGGGAFADVIRQLDVGHGLGEEKSHWLAVQSLSLAARFLAQLLEPRAKVVTSLSECQAVWAVGQIGVIDPEPFARDDIRHADALPQTWEVTSDSMALQLARRWKAKRVILLKSVEAPPGWPTRLENGLVDPWFEKLLAENAGQVAVSVVNLREQVSLARASG